MPDTTGCSAPTTCPSRRRIPTASGSIPSRWDTRRAYYTLWLLFSQTKMVTAAALWQLVDQGALSFADKVADHIPEFARHGKGDVTVYHLLTHQGGFPNARPGPEVWADHARLREAVCD